MFEKRRRRKLAVRHLREAIAQEWNRRGIIPHTSSVAFQRAMYEAGYGRPGDTAYSEMVSEVIDAAVETLSPEDRYIATEGREGRDPFAVKAS